MVSIWCSFFFQRQGGGGQESQFVGGMPVAPVAHAVGALRKALAQSGANAQSDASGGVSGVPPLRTLGLDLETISLAQARKRGLDAVHTAAFAGSQQHALLVVNRYSCPPVPRGMCIKPIGAPAGRTYRRISYMQA